MNVLQELEQEQIAQLTEVLTRYRILLPATRSG